MAGELSTQEPLRIERFFAAILRHGKGEWAGKPFELEPWQRDRIVRPLFGTFRPDGLRQYRTAYVEVPRKNGKTTLGAGIALYLLLADEEPGAEIYSAAADRKQAALVFEAATSMVRQSPKLKERCKIYKNSIVVEKTGSSYQVLSADVPTKHGLNAHAVIFDELHAQRTRDLWDVLKTSMGSRRQPLLFAITTAGYDRESICYEQHKYAERVNDGSITDATFLPVIYGAERLADWQDPAVWHAANPNLGVSLKLEYLVQEAQHAKESPAYQNTFRRLHLCQWTEQETRALDMDEWASCGDPIDLDRLTGRECFIGVDLSSTTDIAAIATVFAPTDEDPRCYVLPHFWIPEEAIMQRVRRDGVPFDAWVRDGFVTATDGAVIDYDVIRAKVNEVNSAYSVREVVFDRWGAWQMMTQLKGDLGEDRVIGYGQGFKDMNTPTKELITLVKDRRLRHGDNPVLRWMASNLSVKQDTAGNLKPAKDASSDRIDGIVATIMALGRALVLPQFGSYMTRGEMLVL